MNQQQAIFRLLIFLLLSLLTGFISDAQKLIKEGSCYIYEGEKYCSDEEKDKLFSVNDDSYYWYKENESSKNTATSMGIVSIVGLVGSTLILSSNESHGGPRELPGLGLGIGIGLVSSVIGIIAINHNNNANFQLRQAIYIFNDGEYEMLSSKKEYEFNFGVTGNGIGMIVSF